MPNDYWSTYAGTICALTINDLNQAAVDVVRSDRVTYVVVGDWAKIEQSLRELNVGPIQVIDSDGSMRERGWGRIVNATSSTIGMVVPNATHYVASKMGVIGFTRALASEVGVHGITVNAIAPSATRTPGTDEAWGPHGAPFEAAVAGQAIKQY